MNKLQSVLDDIAYLTSNGNSFGKVYDNCENAMSGIRQLKGTCWFNSTINGFLLGEYSRILLLQKLKEYLKTHSLEFDKSSCPLFNKNGIYQIIYNTVYLGYQPDTYTSGLLEKTRRKYNIHSVDKQPDDDGDSPIVAVTKILDLLSFKYYLVYESKREDFRRNIVYSFKKEKFFKKSRINKITFDLVNLFYKFDKNKKDVDFYIYRHEEIFKNKSSFPNRKNGIPLEYKNYSLNNIIFSFGANKRKEGRSLELSGGHAINIFRCHNKFYLNDSNLKDSYVLDFEDLNMDSLSKELIRVYKEHSLEYYNATLIEIFNEDSHLSMILIYAKQSEYSKYTQVSLIEKEYFQRFLLSKLHKLYDLFEESLGDDYIDDLYDEFGYVIEDTEGMDTLSFEKYKKNLIGIYKSSKKDILSSLIHTNDTELLDKYKEYKFKKIKGVSKIVPSEKNKELIELFSIIEKYNELPYDIFNTLYKKVKGLLLIM